MCENVYQLRSRETIDLVVSALSVHLFVCVFLAEPFKSRKSMNRPVGKSGLHRPWVPLLVQDNYQSGVRIDFVKKV